jgi:hypothetical protein
MKLTAHVGLMRSAWGSASSRRKGSTPTFAASVTLAHTRAKPRSNARGGRGEVCAGALYEIKRNLTLGCGLDAKPIYI